MTTKKSETKSRKSKPDKLRIIKILFLPLIIIVGVALVIYGGHTHSTGPSKPAKAVSIQLRRYAATQDKFTINFPGTPTVTHHEIPVDGDTIKQSNYESHIPKSPTDFYVIATTYPPSYITPDDLGALQSAAQGEVKNMSGAKIVSNTAGTYEGYTALDTQYSVPQGKASYLVSSRNLIVNNTIYTILVFRGTSDNFVKFANSFQVIQ